jgi:hypothetical protein
MDFRRASNRATCRRIAHVAVFVGALFLVACMTSTTSARADVSSWLSVGGGYGVKHSERSGSFDRATTMSFALGVGSDPLASIVAGGLLRSTTYFTLGTDLGLAARIATGGFARGQWGLALDVGPAWRVFRSATNYGRFPLQAMATLGGPWGVQLGVGADILSLSGEKEKVPLGFVAVLEVDLLRLTVMRQGATDRWWENPSPAGGKLAAWQ